MKIKGQRLCYSPVVTVGLQKKAIQSHNRFCTLLHCNLMEGSRPFCTQRATWQAYEFPCIQMHYCFRACTEWIPNYVTRWAGRSCFFKFKCEEKKRGILRDERSQIKPNKSTVCWRHANLIWCILIRPTIHAILQFVLC